MAQPLRVLVIEDSDDDAILLMDELRRGGLDASFVRAETAAHLEEALRREAFDIIISDYSLPQFTGMEALRIVQRLGLDIPFIMVSGSAPEAVIVEAMRAGARDYVMKSNLMRLPLAVRREIEEAAERRHSRRIDEQLRHAQRLESLGVMAGGIAHDFNNLLTSVLGFSSLTLDILPPDSPARPMIEHVMRAGEQASQLTRQLLAYAGKGRFMVEPLDLSEVTAGARPLLSVSVSRNIALQFELHPGMPQMEGDRGQIQQLLVNLVTNAAEAIGPEKNGVVQVRTGIAQLNEERLSSMRIRNHARSGEFVCLEVRDDGSGMDAATQTRIFDPFYTTKFTGRGLGLSAVSGIVRSHHGVLQVDSAPGRGTTFTVFFPSADGLRPVGRKEQKEPLPLPARSTVLVVDDEEAVRETARAILENHGVQTLVADSGRSAIELFRENAGRISAVLLDLTMPDMSGQETLKRIHAIRPEIPVLMSSGHSEADAVSRLQGDAAGFLQKPYSAGQLVRKIGALLPPGGLEAA